MNGLIKMDVLNKIYSQVSNSVSSTVSQLSGVLPGNPVTREFDATAHIASAGPGLLWKIYKGSKNSTKQAASIFVFEKRQLDKFNKVDRDIILESLRRGITQLTKIRHPRILTVQHPLEESRESLAFATEPVFASLANVLGQTYNMPQPANMSDFELFNIETKFGLLQICEGLAFLHNDVRLLHRNICPESIVINENGAWKIFGFDFCVHSTSPPNSNPSFPFEEFGATLPEVARPSLDYIAPECVLSQSHGTACDMFSLGMVAYAVHSTGHQTVSPVKDLQQFRARAQQFKSLSNNKLQCLPDVLREHVRKLLSFEEIRRLDAHQFLKISYFDDLGIKTLTYLETLLQWDNLQKSQFYKGLPQALTKLPQRVKIQRVLSCLVRDLSQPAMVPFILPSILDIAQDCDQKEFCTYILPQLKPVMKLMEPIQILLILLQRMELLLKLTPAADIQQHVLPMLYRGLDSDVAQIHELCLSVLPTFAGLLDYSNVKNSLLPRIKKLCLSTTTLSVRVNCLLCIGKLLEHLDKWLVIDEVLPFLPQIPSREPAVLMGILGIYKLALNHKKLGISKEIIATRVLPFLMPLSIENGLTLTQFNALVALIKEMFQTVEDEHRTKLEQLNSVKDQQKMLEASMPAITKSKKETDLGQAFTGLGLESFVTSPTVEKKIETQDRKLSLNNGAMLKPNALSQDNSPNNNKSINKTSYSSLSASPSLQQNAPLTLPSPPQSSANFNLQHSWTNNNLVSQNFAPNPQPSVAPLSINQNSSWGNNSNQTFNSMSFNNQSNPWSSTQSLSNNQSRSTSNVGNWSALDSLLPTTSVSMNSYQQPLIASNSVNNNANNMSTKLSNEEIMDLLR